MARLKTLLSWSSGKDSAWMLHLLRGDSRYEVAGLLTTVNDTFERVVLHWVRTPLLRAQARATGLPLIEVPTPNPCSNQQYEEVFLSTLQRAEERGVRYIAFGDLFLEDVRQYREALLARSSRIVPLFPLWGLDTRSLAQTMLAEGLRATITCLDPRQMPRRFAGSDFDEQFLAGLPPGVDPCGEHGEFHTFAWAGPMFEAPLAIQKGEVVERDGFVLADLIPGLQHPLDRGAITGP